MPQKILNNHKIFHFNFFWVIFFKNFSKLRKLANQKKKKEKRKTKRVEITEKPKHARTPPTCNRARLPTSFTPLSSVRQSVRPSCHWRVAGARYTTFARSLAWSFFKPSRRFDFWLAASAVELVCVCVCLSVVLCMCDIYDNIHGHFEVLAFGSLLEVWYFFGPRTTPWS